MDLNDVLNDYLDKNNKCEHLAISIEEINGNIKYYYNELDEMPTASTMKLFVLGALLKKCERGLEDLNRLVKVEKENFYPGSGVMKYLSSGISLKVIDLLTLMIIVSDNSATNLCVDLAGGVEEVNKHIKELGITKAVVNRKVYDPNPNKLPLSLVAPIAFTNYLTKIRTTEYFSKEYKDIFFDILSKQQFKDMFPRYLPLMDFYEDGKVEVFNKTGYDDEARCDCGIVLLEDKREFSYAIMIDGAIDESYSFDNKTHHFMASIGKLFYDTITKNK